MSKITELPNVDTLGNPATEEQIALGNLLVEFVTQCVVDAVSALNTSMSDDEIASVTFSFKKNKAKVVYVVENGGVRSTVEQE